MKKLFLILLTVAFLFMPLMADYTGNTAFLATAITVAANTVEVVGTGIATHSLPLGSQEIIGITCIFTPAGAAADTVDFYFEVSYDDGTTWASLSKDAIAKIPTNQAVVTGESAVRVFYQVIVYGASHIRWSSVDNNDAVNALSGVNVYMSY